MTSRAAGSGAEVLYLININTLSCCFIFFVQVQSVFRSAMFKQFTQTFYLSRGRSQGYKIEGERGMLVSSSGIHEPPLQGKFRGKFCLWPHTTEKALCLCTNRSKRTSTRVQFRNGAFSALQRSPSLHMSALSKDCKVYDQEISNKLLQLPTDCMRIKCVHVRCLCQVFIKRPISVTV